MTFFYGQGRRQYKVVRNNYYRFNYKKLMEDIHIAVKKLEEIFNWYIVNVIDQLLNNFKRTSGNEVLIDADYQINFNYTDLVNKMYRNKKIQVNVSFIHGKSSVKIKDANLLFGYNFNDEMDKYQRPLSKVFKRIDYHTDYNVLEKLKKQISNQSVEVKFWGHSLDKTDEDIIIGIFQLLKEYPTNIITIYYHNDISKFNMLNNLFEILGREEIEKYTSGDRLRFLESPKIEMSN